MKTTIGQILAPENKYQKGINSQEWANRKREWLRRNGAWCRSCKRKGLVLHVHHINYEPGRDVCDYGDDELTCLCEECHRDMHAIIRAFRHAIGNCAIMDLKLLMGHLHVVLEKKGPYWAAMKLKEALLRNEELTHLTPAQKTDLPPADFKTKCILQKMAEEGRKRRR
jgi:hypothetical protein